MKHQELEWLWDSRGLITGSKKPAESKFKVDTLQDEIQFVKMILNSKKTKQTVQQRIHFAVFKTL